MLKSTPGTKIGKPIKGYYYPFGLQISSKKSKSELILLVTTGGLDTVVWTTTGGKDPQIIHAPYKQLNEGNITCTRFEDANGKEYNNWIPAFRLWYAPAAA